MAFSNEQHRRRYAENAKHREQKLAANRAYRAQHRERLNALWRDKWRSDAAYREQHARARLGKIYGLSAEQHRQLLDEQDGVCAICRQSSRRALCVDHCHATQRVRGLLCDKCNTALGLLDEDVGRMLAAVAYLDRARGSATAAAPRRLRSGGVALSPAAVLQNDRRRRGVGDRDVIVAVHLRHLPGQRAAHRHPVEELDALRARELDPVMDRVARERLRIVHDLVQAKLIELLVDESGPLAVELVRQPAGADDHDAQILLVGFRARGRWSGRA